MSVSINIKIHAGKRNAKTVKKNLYLQKIDEVILEENQQHAISAQRYVFKVIGVNIGEKLEKI